jgi:hypothetical protein
MSEDELACEYEKALTNRYMVQVKLRSTSKQGLKKIHFSASKYVRVDLSSREKDILDLCSPFMSAIAEAGKGKLVCIG